ncbi:acyl-CoA desaturase [Aquimarina sp. AD1]|uniref:fatty acid desaturase family protein n=1 Tax=Aquimarina TaxID=290174 RepID=UPI000406E1A7|nr:MULTISPECIES: acyl-CoA desaturase [Aquimarina]AXT58243.1 acyl-CoA desaturase [Aquimarina sp. AD1]RKN09516.1 acyl-CoA desaturase [Aquimarina sp. AD1]
MKKIKFSKDEGSDFYKELNERIRNYFESNQIDKTGNRKMVFKIVMYFSLVFLFYFLMLISSDLGAFFVFYIGLGISVLLNAFNVSHDAAHGVAVKSKFWNKLLFQLSFNLQGNNAYVWGKNHNESHHLYTNIEGSDIDVLNNPLVRMTTEQNLQWYHRFQYLYVPFLYLFYSLNWFLFREFLMIFNRSSRTIKIKIPTWEIFKLIFFKIAYITYMIIIPGIVLPFAWEYIFVAFLLNHFLVSILFTGVLGVSHLSDYVVHPQPDSKGKLAMSWPKLQMCTSVDYNVNSTFLNWTLGGFNAHALHHLLPNICHIHYIKLLPIFREVAKKYGIVYMEMSYSQALRSHFRFLKKMGTQLEFKTMSYEI